MNDSKVCVVFGGESAEHDVSIMSARAVIRVLIAERRDPAAIYVTKTGAWALLDCAGDVLGGDSVPWPARYLLRRGSGACERICEGSCGGSDLFSELNGLGREGIPVVMFPLIHGAKGEDGTLQGFFEILGLPYVGSGILGSAICMNKALAHSVLAAAGIPVVPQFVVRRAEFERDPDGSEARAIDVIQFPMFVKPANGGSSIGVSRVERREDLRSAMLRAASLDEDIIVQIAIPARELELAVIGDDDELLVSGVGEVIPAAAFYDFKDKYEHGTARLVLRALISPADERSLREMAVKAYRAVRATGFARVDFFMNKVNGQIYLNEINTLPGFTEVSMFPKLLMESGVTYISIIDRLVELALRRKRAVPSQQIQRE